MLNIFAYVLLYLRKYIHHKYNLNNIHTYVYSSTQHTLLNMHTQLHGPSDLSECTYSIAYAHSDRQLKVSARTL